MKVQKTHWDVEVNTSHGSITKNGDKAKGRFTRTMRQCLSSSASFDLETFSKGIQRESREMLRFQFPNVPALHVVLQLPAGIPIELVSAPGASGLNIEEIASIESVQSAQSTICQHGFVERYGFMFSLAMSLSLPPWFCKVLYFLVSKKEIENMWNKSETNQNRLQISKRSEWRMKMCIQTNEPNQTESTSLEFFVRPFSVWQDQKLQGVAIHKTFKDHQTERCQKVSENDTLHHQMKMSETHIHVIFIIIHGANLDVLTPTIATPSLMPSEHQRLHVRYDSSGWQCSSALQKHWFTWFTVFADDKSMDTFRISFQSMTHCSEQESDQYWFTTSIIIIIIIIHHPSYTPFLAAPRCVSGRFHEELLVSRKRIAKSELMMDKDVQGICSSTLAIHIHFFRHNCINISIFNHLVFTYPKCLKFEQGFSAFGSVFRLTHSGSAKWHSSVWSYQWRARLTVA